VYVMYVPVFVGVQHLIIYRRPYFFRWTLLCKSLYKCMLPSLHQSYIFI